MLTRIRDGGMGGFDAAEFATAEGWLQEVDATGSDIVRVLKLNSETVTSLKGVKSTTSRAGSSLSSFMVFGTGRKGHRSTLCRIGCDKVWRLASES
jgi:hypothetical protein